MTLALEINDAGLLLAAEGALLAEEPGVAMLDGREPETGTAALLRARLKPLYAETHHWQDLGTVPLARAVPAAASYAEIAYAQLAGLARAHLARGPDVLVAAPAGYSREQLGLLLGIAQEAGLKPVGLVDAGLAAASLEPAPDSVLQLELGLHRVVLSVLDHAGDLRRTRFEVLPRHGWLALQQAWLELIASSFVRRTRYDPLHEAASEQRLCDGLPQWLAASTVAATVPIEVEAAGMRHSIELAADAFSHAVERIYDDIVRMLQRARPASGPLHLRLSHRLAVLPGFEARLAAIRDCEVVRLPRGAAALGALAYERVLRPDRGSLVLVQHLPVPRRAGSAREQATAATVPAGERPTHVIHESRAYRLDGRPLTLGWSVPDGRRALVLASAPGISRAHCTLARANGGVWLEDHSTYGTLVNGARVSGRVELRTGDRLRIGSPGVECELVRQVDDDGTA